MCPALPDLFGDIALCLQLFTLPVGSFGKSLAFSSHVSCTVQHIIFDYFY